MLAELNRQVVVLSLGGNAYAIDVAQVQEIIRPLPISRVPFAPPVIAGVVNLRGRILPIVDPRPALGVAPRAGRGSRVVVTEVGGTTLGIPVDSVIDILPLSETVAASEGNQQPVIDITANLAGMLLQEGNE